MTRPLALDIFVISTQFFGHIFLDGKAGGFFCDRSTDCAMRGSKRGTKGEARYTKEDGLIFCFVLECFLRKEASRLENQVERLLRGAGFRELLDVQTADVREKYGLKKVDIEVLFYLHNNKEKNTASDIQKSLHMNKGYLSQVLDHLNKLGYVNVIPDKDDRRYVHYFASEKTKDIAEDIHKVWNRVNERMFQGVPENEVEIFRKVAKAICQNIKEMSTD